MERKHSSICPLMPSPSSTCHNRSLGTISFARNEQRDGILSSSPQFADEDRGGDLGAPRKKKPLSQHSSIASSGEKEALHQAQSQLPRLAAGKQRQPRQFGPRERGRLPREPGKRCHKRKRDRSAPRSPEIDSHMFERPLTLASVNVRGLRRDSPKPKEIKAWMASLSSPPQVLLIQEHHLGKEDIQNSTKGLEFWNGTTLWNEGIPMGRSQRISAGTAILIDRATTPLIKDHDTLMEGRAQYVSL